MKCPKCGKNISEESLVCPHCKKVLKLICPNCGAENKSNTCEKCGFVIITKCHKCGKLNQTINGKCSKCGFSTYTSAAINSSNIDEFACLTVEFPNLENFKNLFGSTKLFDKFKVNLDNLIVNYTKNFHLKREIIDDVYIIRFNKDYTFADSASNAMRSAIAIQNLVTELNYKLSKLKISALECRIAILKRDIYSKPSDYKAGINIKVFYDSTKEMKLLNKLQIITDNSIYNEISNKYSLSSLTAVMVKNSMVMFFELNLKKYIKIPKDKKAENSNKKVKQIIEQNIEAADADYDGNVKNVIKFNEINCIFETVENVFYDDEIASILKNKEKNLISVKHDKNFLLNPEQLITKISSVRKFDNVVEFTCTEEMKLKPYGFFVELICQLFQYSQSPLLVNANNYDIFNSIDKSGFIKDLINLNKRDFPHPEDCRFSLMDIFLNTFYGLKNTLIIVENIDKIDETSLEFLQVILEKFETFDINFVFFNSSGFSLHKHSHFLLEKSFYTELRLKKSKIKNLLSKFSKVTDVLLDTPYLEVISKYSQGNAFYFEEALDYLFSENIIEFSNGEVNLAEAKDILILPSIEKLIEYKINKVALSNRDIIKMLTEIVLVGGCIDYNSLNLLGIKDAVKYIKVLMDEKLVFVNKNTVIVKNFEVVRKSLSEVIAEEDKLLYANELLSKMFGESKTSVYEVYLYNITGRMKDKFITLQNLSEVNASLGDFGSYWECCKRLLKLIDEHITEASQAEVDKYKMQIYENLAGLLYKYTPEKIQHIAQVILDNLEKCGNDDEIVVLCNKMLQGCLICGNYSHALKLIHNILSRYPNKSFNPGADDFDITFFMLTMIKIEILFSIGDLNDCANAGDEILKIFTRSNIFDYRPANVPEKQFEELVFDSFMFSGISKVLLLKDDLNTYLSELKNTISIGKSTKALPTSFELLIQIENLIHGYNVILPKDTSKFTDKFSIIFLNILKAFREETENPQKFANYIYEAKLTCESAHLKQFELFCDLLIGYSYLRLSEYKKASDIFYDIEETASKNGLKTVLYVCWYFISLLKAIENDFDSAINIASDVSLKMEQSENSSDYLQFLIKLLLKNLYKLKGANNEAEFCQKHINFLQMKYNLKVSSE